MTTAPCCPERLAFLSAIRREPADDTARLAYADWLDEQVHPGGVGEAADGDRAKLIRLQVALARNPDLWRCGSVSDRWCPACGDCRCPHPEESLDDPACPLHSVGSLHACREREHKLRLWEAARMAGAFWLSASSVYAEIGSPTISMINSYTEAMTQHRIARWDRGFLAWVEMPVGRLERGAPKHADALALLGGVAFTDFAPELHPRFDDDDPGHPHIVIGVDTAKDNLFGSRLPMPIWERLAGYVDLTRRDPKSFWPDKTYPNRVAAVAAASKAAAAWARSLCEVPRPAEREEAT